MKKFLLSFIIFSTFIFSACSNSSNVIGATNLNSNENNNSNEYYFSQNNGHCDLQLIKVINSSKSSLDIAIYSITKPNIVNAIKDAKIRGVNVRIITDKIESNTKAQKKELLLLSSAGIPIKINTHKGLQHMKVTIADDNTVTTGSYNYTESATVNNDEVLVIIHDNNAAKQFESEFTRMWNDNSNFKDY